MPEAIFGGLAPLYRKGAVSRPISFYFSIDEVKRTVILDADTCTVTDGKTDGADCVCKTGKELFLRIWEQGYRPGMKDFLNGAIKSNAPHLLQQFLTAFGK